MPDYVYALHDFQPEHDDEVSFRQGERIEVVERDDLYNDGWWQGRNLAGKFGLFPRSYTTAAPPTAGPPSVSIDPPVPQASGTLQPLHEEPESSSPNEQGAANWTGNIINNHAKQPSQGEEVMKATMTDVQKAIEQLGRNNGNGVRDDRSFSFASMRSGDGDVDSDTDIDTDRETDAGGDDWHRGARMKLAEQARKVVEEQKKQEEENTPVVRTIAPPIEVEMSDESEGEDDDDGHHHTGYAREHPHISEEDEDEAEALRAHAEPQEGHAVPPDIDAPIPDESQLPTATVQRTAFSNILPITQLAGVKAKHSSATSLPTPISPGGSSNAIPSVEPIVNRAVSPALSIPEKQLSQATPIPTPSTVREAHATLPSPAASSIGQQQGSKHSSLASSTGQALNSLQSPTFQRTTSMDRKPTTHPSEWTVEEVVDWLRSKGFGDDVCDKFIEQEITGDVLLDLDVNLLKSEIGIPAFGKRMRIANSIADLRRPPSVVYSDHITNQSQSISQSQSQPYGLSHSHSHSQSVHSSTQASLNSPYYGHPFSPGFGSIMSAESPTHTGDLPGTPLSPLAREQRRVSDPVSIAGRNTNLIDADDQASGIRGGMVGLGLGIPGASFTNVYKNRPAQLTLSPSDSNLMSSKAVGGDIPEEADEERAIASENENAHSVNKRRHMFGYSTESGSSTKHESPTNKLSKEAPPSPRPSAKGSSDDRAFSRGSRRQRSMDSSRPTDRHSLFGNPFNGTIGKSRKPAPRYSIMDHDPPSEKPSTLNLSRLYGGSYRKSSGRPSTSDGSTSATSPKELRGTKEKEDKKEKEKKAKTTEKGINDEEFGSSAVLRKRTELNGEIPTRSMQALKPGQSVLEQIGEPDHKGWMRKKGDRYNSWKSRYFVLKGPHMYILKSEDKSETKIKGYVNIAGYKVLADENTDPGRYGFRIVHDTDKTHFFSSAEHNVIREWMKAIMKATIGRDYTKAVVSSCNIPTIPLTVAQAMSPAPRPPSPTARAATQRAHRQENPNQLTSRDARVLMSLLSTQGVEDAQATFFDPPLPQNEKKAVSLNSPVSANLPPISHNAPQLPPMNPKSFTVPPRPSRRSDSVSAEFTGIVDANLIEWANSHLPPALQIRDPGGSLCGGLALFRLAESIRGKPSSPPILDSAFPSGPNDDKLDGLFKLFDFLLDNDVKVGSVSINEVRQGKRDKIVQLLIALKAWDDKRKAIEQSIVKGGPANVSYWAHV